MTASLRYLDVTVSAELYHDTLVFEQYVRDVLPSGARFERVIVTVETDDGSRTVRILFR